MGDPSDTVEILTEISRTMEDHRTQLETSLNTTFETLHSEYGLQWVMTLETVYDVAARRSEGATFPMVYQPRGYQPQVGDLAPYPRENTRIVGFNEEVIPIVVDAREAFRTSLPAFERIGPGSIGDIGSLIQFPQSIAAIYDHWKQVSVKIAPLPAELRGLGQLNTMDEGNGLYGWSGPGASAYQDVVSDAVGATEAVREGVNNVLTDLLSVVKLSVGVCRTLSELLIQRIDNLQSLASTIERLEKDPFSWLAVVKAIADQAIELNKRSLEEFTKRLDDLLDLAVLHKDIDAQFTSLAAALGSGLSWPEPRAGMQARWAPGS